jgi:hypothetical protein
MENYRNAFTLFLRKFRLIGKSLKHKPKARGFVPTDVLPSLAARKRQEAMNWIVNKIFEERAPLNALAGAAQLRATQYAGI